MLAQAQESFCIKAGKGEKALVLFISLVACWAYADRIKDQVMAKLAMQASDLYADALSNMQVGSIKSMWEKVI